jgi:general secretion pathway protein I
MSSERALSVAAKPRRHVERVRLADGQSPRRPRLRGSDTSFAAVTPRCAGFTLLEVLVALAVFSLAALALLRLQGASIATATRLDEKLIAAIALENRAAEFTLQIPAPAYGTTSGQTNIARRPLTWTATVERTPDPALQSINLAIIDASGGVLASQTLIRPAT